MLLSGTAEKDKEAVPSWLLVETNKAAREMIRAIDKRKPEAIITGHGKVFVKLERHTPWLVSGVIKRLGLSTRKEPKQQ